jgi:hypothetical protein
MVHVGDVANSFVILNKFAFMATVVAQTLGYVDVLSPAFQSLVRVGGGVKSPPRASPGPRAH